ncbi:MAG: hypothetical protein ACI9G1_003706 [Pirellulaceae bacterium]
MWTPPLAAEAMNTVLLIQILGVLIVLFFFFATFMCSKTWKFVHVTFSLFTFAAAITFIVFLSLTMKTHSAWRSIGETLEADIKRVTAENELTLNGNPNDPASARNSIRFLRQELDRVTLDRGRVWRECTIVNSSVSGISGSVTVELPAPRRVQANVPAPAPAPAPDPADPADPAPPVEPAPVVVAGVGLEADALVYVFQEQEFTPPGMAAVKIPKIYVGEFRVTAVNNTQVQMIPTMPVFQGNLLQPGAGTWTIHATMPIDTHFTVRNDSNALVLDWLDMPLEMDEQDMNDLMAGVATKDQYLRDFGPTQADDPDDAVWHKVEFIKRAAGLPVDSNSTYAQLAGDYFDASGLAVEQRLRRGEDVEIVAGMVGIFDQAKAKELVSAGLCDESTVEHIYVRPLRDYQVYFRDIYDRRLSLVRLNQQVNTDVNIVVSANTTSDKFKALKISEKTDLETDLKGYQQELAELSQFSTALKSQKVAVQDRLRQLYRETVRIEERLDEINRILKADDSEAPANPTPPATTASADLSI